METIGLLSGIGRLPVDVALSAKSMGYRVIAVGVVPDIDPELAEAVDAYYDIHIGKIGKIISTLKKNDVKTVTMIGTVSYTHLTLPTTSRRQRQMCIRDRSRSWKVKASK